MHELPKMFFLIGLGDPKDLTVKGLEIIKICDRVYLKSYTSVLSCGKEALEEYYDRELMLADRESVAMLRNLSVPTRTRT